MPNSATAKTASARRAWILAAGLAAILALAGLAALVLPSSDDQVSVGLPGHVYRLELGAKPTPLATHGRYYYLPKAATLAAQEKGLGGRDSLPQDNGMLFWYDQAQQRCFWMKDMRFALDIIWADVNKKVTHIENELAPTTYPQTYCARGKYVIELNAGQAARNDLHVGDSLRF